MKRKSNFAIHAICVAKNESDVIAAALLSASAWADAIYVVDNGSDDNTWEVVSELSKSIPLIHAFGQVRKPFREGLRSLPFNAFRHTARKGDWWCRLDADEFYVDSPRDFLASVGRHEHVVWGAAIEYYLTSEDVSAIDFSQPCDVVLPQIRYYRANNSEVRFFKHRNGLNWSENESFPRHLGVVHRRRIRYRHYKYRSPEQILRRLRTRKQAVDDGGQFYWSGQSQKWTDFLAQRASLLYDDGCSELKVEEQLLPLHRESLIRYAVKRFMHGAGFWA